MRPWAARGTAVLSLLALLVAGVLAVLGVLDWRQSVTAQRLLDDGVVTSAHDVTYERVRLSTKRCKGTQDESRCVRETVRAQVDFPEGTDRVILDGTRTSDDWLLWSFYDEAAARRYTGTLEVRYLADDHGAVMTTFDAQRLAGWTPVGAAVGITAVLVAALLLRIWSRTLRTDRGADGSVPRGLPTLPGPDSPTPPEGATAQEQARHQLAWMARRSGLFGRR